MSKLKGFYSVVDEAAKSIKRSSGTGQAFINDLKKVGVKPAELKERGLDKIAAMPKITKEELLTKIEKNPAPKFEEKVLREPSKREIEDRAHEMAYDDAFDELRAEGMNRHEAEDVAAEMAEDRMSEYLARAAEDISESGEGPYHSNYTIPGGENYREILLKMPSFKGETKLKELEAMRRRVDPELHSHRYNDLTKQIDALKAEKAAMPEQFRGVGAHFGGEPGVLASIRVSDRVGPKGEKVLHVEEIQSDWHQQGRNKGYKETPDTEGWTVKSPNPYEPNEVIVYDQNGKAVWTGTNSFGTDRQIIDKVSGRLQAEKLPDAPFKENWHELAMKRMLNYAAENGYDKVAITPGAEQADRYSLAKYLNGVDYTRNELSPSANELVAYDKNGRAVIRERGVLPEDLHEHIGKEAAKKLLAQETRPNEYGLPTHSLKDEELVVGGEGMKRFYDELLPSYLNKYGQKYGAQVTPMDIITHPETSTPQIAAPGIGHFPEPIVEPAKTAPVHSFEITPQMREEITGKGLPLYQQIGIPTGGAAAGAGALDQEEQGFADGGVVKAAVGGEYNTEPDMADGGSRIQSTVFKKGGRVHLSQNPDTMLLDLMSRS